MKQSEKKAIEQLRELLNHPEKLKQPGVFEQAVLLVLDEMNQKLNKLYERNTIPLIK